MNCELCGKKEDERAMQEQCGLSLCLSCDGKHTDQELREWKFEEGKCPPSRHEMEFYEFSEDGRYYHGFECHSCGEIQTG